MFNMQPPFKTVKDLLDAKNLDEVDTLTRRAVLVVQRAQSLAERAHTMGIPQALEEALIATSAAALAIARIDSERPYAFLADPRQLGLDARNLYKFNVERGVVIEPDELASMIESAEAQCDEVDANTPKPSVVITGDCGVQILRGVHALQALAESLHRNPVANDWVAA